MKMFDFFKKDNGKVVHVNDMEQLIGKVELIDIREPYEYKSGSLKTAKNIPMGTLLASSERYLTKDKTYYILCQSGARSGRTVNLLTKQGFNVINVAGGMGSYVGTNRK
jgi:rhodanese-related sulfurtransferase